MDDISLQEVEDILDVKESVDFNLKSRIQSTEVFKQFEDDINDIISDFISKIETISPKIKFDSDNKEHMNTLRQVMIETINKF
jgi:hypothetical protein